MATDQMTVLNAVIARLRDRLGLNESSCFFSAYPKPIAWPMAAPTNFVTVSPPGGTFNPELHEGGGEFQTCEETGVIISPFSRIKLDRVGQEIQLMEDHARGLVRQKWDILRAMSAHFLTADGEFLLRNTMAPKDCTPPDYDKAAGIGWWSLTFTTDFDWDLTS